MQASVVCKVFFFSLKLEFKILLLLYKILNNYPPSYFEDLIVPQSSSLSDCRFLEYLEVK